MKYCLETTVSWKGQHESNSKINARPKLNIAWPEENNWLKTISGKINSKVSESSVFGCKLDWSVEDIRMEQDSTKMNGLTQDIPPIYFSPI